MLTRALFLAASWFLVSFIATVIFGHRLRIGHPLLSLMWLVLVLLAGNLWAVLTFGVPLEMALLTMLAFVASWL